MPDLLPGAVRQAGGSLAGCLANRGARRTGNIATRMPRVHVRLQDALQPRPAAPGRPRPIARPGVIAGRETVSWGYFPVRLRADTLAMSCGSCTDKYPALPPAPSGLASGKLQGQPRPVLHRYLSQQLPEHFQGRWRRRFYGQPRPSAANRRAPVSGVINLTDWVPILGSMMTQAANDEVGETRLRQVLPREKWLDRTGPCAGPRDAKAMA
jgi:hypothetical protein